MPLAAIATTAIAQCITPRRETAQLVIAEAGIGRTLLNGFVFSRHRLNAWRITEIGAALSAQCLIARCGRDLHIIVERDLFRYFVNRAGAFVQILVFSVVRFHALKNIFNFCRGRKIIGGCRRWHGVCNKNQNSAY